LGGTTYVSAISSFAITSLSFTLSSCSNPGMPRPARVESCTLLCRLRIAKASQSKARTPNEAGELALATMMGIVKPRNTRSVTCTAPQRYVAGNSCGAFDDLGDPVSYEYTSVGTADGTMTVSQSLLNVLSFMDALTPF